MRQFDPSQPLIFIHVPKTAGNSVRETVFSWFEGRSYRHYFDPANQTMPPRRDLAQLGAQHGPPLIMGHFNKRRGFGIQDYYPQVSQFLTILRDPLEMHVSRFHYTRRVRKTGAIHDDIGDSDLDAHINTGHLNMLEHFPHDMTLDNYRELLSRDFIDIGCLDTLGPSLRRMAERLGRPAPTQPVPRKNASSEQVQLTQAQRDVFRQRFPLEHAIYDHAKQMSAC